MTIPALLRTFALVSVTLAASTPAFAESGPFAGFAGAWSGSGTISIADGSKERLRCRANYRAADTDLQQTLRCASDSYKFELSSNVASSGDRISGTWSETSRGISGSLEGRAAGGRITVAVDAPGFSANLSLVKHRNRQSVSITSQSEIRNISISLARN
jgi:hypothetical protein